MPEFPLGQFQIDMCVPTTLCHTRKHRESFVKSIRELCLFGRFASKMRGAEGFVRKDRMQFNEESKTNEARLGNERRMTPNAER